ncbi:MAG: hypothetical protein OQK04_18745, partial [Kangiellaceae bacterium]|nr:hypothetical protein [Kangiellaceae bacterium]
MKKNLIAALVASALVSPFALADSPSFSYIEGGYSNGSLDQLDLTGFYLEGSVEVGEYVFLTA